MSNISRAAQKADDSDSLDHVIRVGLIAYGVVHLLIGWLALQIAFGEKAKNASGTGALEYLARQPFGGVLIWVVAIGMVALVLWRLLEAWQGWQREDDNADRAKAAVPQLFKGVLYAMLAWSALQVATNSSGGGSGTDGLTAKLLQLPAGQLIVGAIGLGIVGYGGYYVYQGWSDKFLEKLDGRPQNADVSKAYRWVGKAGHIGKGASIAVIGALFTYAAATHDANKSAGLDRALQEVAQAPFGQLLLTLVALGIACYGVFAFARARHFDR
ncbi:DUF1206 domain-containing protein [Nocardioides aestuarii]|uniref:DUF1206 domain-containing protein n=1 Tax=Nocardioides aestuarii TaxID=252231 RepID=A0ABW4TK06_9ACTN